MSKVIPFVLFVAFVAITVALSVSISGCNLTESHKTLASRHNELKASNDEAKAELAKVTTELKATRLALTSGVNWEQLLGPSGTYKSTEPRAAFSAECTGNTVVSDLKPAVRDVLGGYQTAFDWEGSGFRLTIDDITIELSGKENKDGEPSRFRILEKALAQPTEKITLSDDAKLSVRAKLKNWRQANKPASGDWVIERIWLFPNKNATENAVRLRMIEAVLTQNKQDFLVQLVADPDPAAAPDRAGYKKDVSLYLAVLERRVK